jgi:pyruvate kinase
MNRLTLLWGAYTHRVRKLSTTAEIFASAKTTTLSSGMGLKNDRIVVVCGDPSTPEGTTDLLRVQQV